MPDYRVTLVPCLACGGEFRVTYEDGTRYRTHTCRWCSSGAMTPEQIQEWIAFSERRRTDPDPRK